MDRNTGTIVLCLALGGAVMYGTTHYRINVEPVAPPGAPAPQVAHAPHFADPRLLPEEVAPRTRATEPPMRDPKVRPAAALLADPASDVTIKTVGDGTAQWVFSDSKTDWPVANAQVTLSLAPGFKGDGLQFRVNAKDNDAKFAPVIDTPANAVNLVKAGDFTQVRVDFTKLADTSGLVKLQLQGTSNKMPLGGSADIVFRAPGAKTGGLSGVQVTNYSNSSHRDPVGFESKVIPVYGRQDVVPYLRLTGRGDAKGSRIAFVLQPDGGEASELTPAPGAKLTGEDWDATFKLPRLFKDATATVLVRAFNDKGQIYDEKSVTVQFKELPKTLDAPTLGTPTVTAPTVIQLAPPTASAGMTAYYTNAKSAQVVATATDAGDVLVLFVGGTAKAPQNKTAAGAEVNVNRQATFTINDLTPGSQVIGVAVARGDLLGPPAQIKLMVETRAPVVEDVKGAPDFGQVRGAADKITVRFNTRNPIDAETVQTAGFEIKHDQNVAGTTVTVTSAVLDPVTNTITLTVTGIVPGTFTLGIPTGTTLRDVFGNKLPQSPVVNRAYLYEAPLATPGATAAGGAALPSRTVGITNQTGPPVNFPEYVKFRVSPDGFNPSDRVETRVMRLYYYRDAHRVAQLINRTVKSYNAATVDVRRRAADGVRDNADKAEDDRKTLEARAVRAAQDARAAEAEVANLQSGIATARNQSAAARVELLQRQQELEQAKRDLARAELLTPGRTDSDVALEEQRQLLDALGRDRTSVSRALTGAVEPEKTRLTNQLAEIDDRIKVEKRRLDRLLAENSTRADSGADAARARVKALEVEIGKLQSVSTTGDLVERANTDKLAAAQSNLAGKRESEAKAVEAWQVKELQERRLRENQFRTETAALREDPDTYAPGNPNSVDAVMQVSVSVIGEGLIQLRGPIKGLNVIRTMVNQIDAPVGQVRVAVHTLQVNGERADRMEKVVANIQRYLDHSRFLTAQSSVMLRNAVTSVAARKAAEVAATLAPGCTQWDRDQKYLYAFFGKDFIDELMQLDSEFLKTGNKLLSLNSMDSTSLSSALFLMALAKNDVRIEIINEFQATVMRELPQAEWKYYMAGISQPKHCDACKDRKEYLLANNSQFQSFVGFFNSQVTGNDTLNPLQREFVKLAQIFKARMVTEMQLRQRVMERALLEERFGQKYSEEREKVIKLEEEAKEELNRLRKSLPNALGESRKTVTSIESRVREVDSVLHPTSLLILDLSNEDIVGEQPEIEKKLNELKFEEEYRVKQVPGAARLRPEWIVKFVDCKNQRFAWTADFSSAPDLQRQLTEILDFLDQFVYLGKANQLAFDRARATILKLTTGKPESQRLYWGSATHKEEYPVEGNTPYIQFLYDLDLLEQLIRSETSTFRVTLRTLQNALEQDTPDLPKAFSAFQAVRDMTNERLKPGGRFATAISPLLNGAQESFGAMMSYQAALKRARDARRPLDEKKLLDLLVDEMEDKYVEILEGTRAHTSNVDNYLKSIATALDDDFNTQYYLPSFRRAREASRYWDVTLAQIETTSVLTNNRALGKVSPAASFEFDLPKRDILLTEGFKSAKALFDEYGALMNDPSFLALAKIYSGNPVSMMQGGGGGLSSVRSVLPGLPTSTDEKILAQAGPGRREFGAALDGLIPDPAIYKFETGTGYEIRPVLSPDGQAVVFGFDYMYTTDVREPVRADEKHLGRVKRHFVSTDVQLGNYELREVSKYMVSIKVARTGKGVQLLQDIPGVGVLFRPLPSAGASLQQNLIYSQATIFPTLFDLMGLRYAPAVADLDPLADRMSEFAARYRRLDVEQRVYDIGSTRVDDALRTPYGERRYDLYRPPVSLPFVHPNGYTGIGLRLYNGTLREGYDPNEAFPDSRFAPGTSLEGRPKPFNFGTQPGAPGYDLPGYPLPHGSGPEYGAHPVGPYPTHAGRAQPTPPVPPGAMRVPGYGSVGVGQQVPFNPSFSTTPPAQRPSSELPTTGQQTSITPGGPPVSRPSAPTSLPPVRPAQPAVPPLPTVPPGIGGTR